MQTARELQDLGNLLPAQQAGPLLSPGQGTRGDTGTSQPSPSSDTITCLHTSKRKPRLRLTQVLDQSKRTGRIYDREPLDSLPAARDGKVRQTLDLREEIPSAARSPPAVPVDAPRAPQGAGAATASAGQEPKVTGVSAARAGRSVQHGRHHIPVPTPTPELEKIKHSYAYPSTPNTFSLTDYRFQMKATEGRKT